MVLSATGALFDQHRPLLFGIAYRMLGSVMDAEDAVQETWLRWQRAAPPEVSAPKTYLATIITRLCLDQLRAAHTRREQYIGPWLPEPLIGDPVPAAEAATLAVESLSLAFLVLLESLTPVERAVFLLHDVFGFEFSEIAPIVDKQPANCRQIARRARTALDARQPRFEPAAPQHQELLAQFIHACTTGDLQGLITLLTADVTLWSDGGGVVQAARNPIYSAAKVAPFLLGILRKLPADLELRVGVINGQPGLLTYHHGTPIGVLVIEPHAGRISAIRLVVNPHKLGAIPPLPTSPPNPLP